MKKPTILIVDDEKEFTDTFSKFISDRFNAKVIVRKNTMEAIDILDKQRVDVLFQDMILPGPGGDVVIDHVKNLDRLNEMIVFIISKWQSTAQILKFENHQVKYIPKPISLSTTQRILIEDFETKGGFDYKKKK